ncbi:unnamed protein product [Eruca vesicaria subsp. sativa]|uniref:Uncharacterized protein n=1 Tax=Eruca vesicaria subsp. sativa TaxID=29727 RepID=A0ABC8KGM2_ERUVS|nr:unnamed protein product [Eruca vesicaria subsp. sativa]
MTGVSICETTKAIRMDDEWWNDRIQEVSDASKLRAHPFTDIDILDRLFGENETDTVNLEDDSDAPSGNQNETSSSYNQSSKRVYGNTSRSSSSACKRGATKVSHDFVTNEAYMKQTEIYERA